MKLSTKPKSSPGRTTEDFPPPLIMFPRSKSNRGSRSRSNPMFIRKINTGNEANLEPSSPKVTCIGQVRVKRSNKQTITTTTTAAVAVRRWKWLRKLKPIWFRRVWRNDFEFFRCDCCRKSEKVQEPKVNQIIDVIGGGSNGGLISELSPPRNVLLLMRSRSAPYRCSSVANEICESNGVDVREDDEITKKNAGEEMVIEEENEGVNEDIGKENKEDEASINCSIEEYRAKPL